MHPDITSLNQSKSAETSSVGYTVNISPNIHERLEKHIFLLKKLIDTSLTKQRWLLHAIKEKLDNDAMDNSPPKPTTLHVKIDAEIDKKLLKRVEFIKKFRYSYSKKQWIVDAVLEKLDRDEKEVQKSIVDPNQSQNETCKQLISRLQTELEKLKNQL